jgi:hypothetical protein
MDLPKAADAASGATAKIPQVRWHGRGDVRVELVPEARAPRDGEVRIRVTWWHSTH